MLIDRTAFQVFEPEGSASAAVFVVHGMQEHKNRYIEFAQYLQERGIVCLIYDLPGHGDNTENEELGWFGDKDGWRVLVHSAVDAAKYLREKHPDLPLVYFGHSMGTMVGRCFLQQYDELIDGMILSGAPAYMPAGTAGILVADVLAKFKGKHGHDKLLDTLATGSFNKGIENPRTPLDWLSFNEANVDAYIADERCGVPFTIQGYRDLFVMMDRMGKKKNYRCLNPDLPIYLFAGEQDPCIGGETGFRATEQLFKDAGYTFIETKLYPDMRHETLNETDHLSVMEDTVQWILKKMCSK